MSEYYFWKSEESFMNFLQAVSKTGVCSTKVLTSRKCINLLLTVELSESRKEFLVKIEGFWCESEVLGNETLFALVESFNCVAMDKIREMRFILSGIERHGVFANNLSYLEGKHNYKVVKY